jgi:hypothetical protein
LDKQKLEGLWTPIRSEVGGVYRPPELVDRMAQMVLLVGDYLSGWDGLWAAVTYGFEGGTWAEGDVKDACRHIILGTDREGIPLAPDFYLWAGGRFRVATDLWPGEIDLEQFWRGEVLPSKQLGLYCLACDRLTLCLSESGRARPSKFRSDEHSYQCLEDFKHDGARRTKR